MNRRLKKLVKQLELAGGTVMMPDDLPEEIADAFLEELLNCPDCARALAEQRPIPRSRREH